MQDIGGKARRKGLGMVGIIILKWILVKQDGMVWTGFIFLRIGTIAGSSEHGNELSHAITC
jgi:hypothetical protein